MFMQLSTLQMYPVVAADSYKSWKDLDGQEVAVHSRGSGTEAIMRLAAEKNGIKYSGISYIPGSEVRTGALLQGNVKATIVDASGKRILEAQAPGKFLYLPLDDLTATDEGLFANTDYLKEHPQEVATLVEAILTTWREVAKDPGAVARLREEYKLLPDASPEMVAEIDPYFAEAAKAGLPLAGGGEEGGEGRLRLLHDVGGPGRQGRGAEGRGLLGVRAAEGRPRQARSGLKVGRMNSLMKIEGTGQAPRPSPRA